MAFPLLISDVKIAVIGLGYVGLPLLLEFGKVFPCVGFDLDASRVAELTLGRDSTGEVSAEAFRDAKSVNFTTDEKLMDGCNVFIVAVPTDIDKSRRPNLRPLRAASLSVGRSIKPGGLVIYESTVYPGATEEECLPLVESASGLTLNKDFFAGYSPERINPGDKKRPLSSIVKITSGSTSDTADFVDCLYKTVITAGTYRASSLKVAEAAKVIENTQRDVNIALVNELSILFSHLGIDTNEVLDAAASKWNFIRLKPGLVGGHCIGVDPYYLVDKSMSVGYVPDIIRLSREINDGMAKNAASRLVKAMIRNGLQIRDSKVLIAGFAYKENCKDTRNTKVVDFHRELQEYGINCELVDCRVDAKLANERFGLSLSNVLPSSGTYDAIVLAVPHLEYTNLGIAQWRALLRANGVFFDMHAVFKLHESDLRL